MKKTKFRRSAGSTAPNMDYGKALMNQKGGWTLAELKPGRSKNLKGHGEFTNGSFNTALRQASRRVSEPESRRKRT